MSHIMTANQNIPAEDMQELKNMIEGHRRETRELIRTVKDMLRFLENQIKDLEYELKILNKNLSMPKFKDGGKR